MRDRRKVQHKRLYKMVENPIHLKFANLLIVWPKWWHNHTDNRNWPQQILTLNISSEPHKRAVNIEEEFQTNFKKLVKVFKNILERYKIPNYQLSHKLQTTILLLSFPKGLNISSFLLKFKLRSFYIENEWCYYDFVVKHDEKPYVILQDIPLKPCFEWFSTTATFKFEQNLFKTKLLQTICHPYVKLRIKLNLVKWPQHIFRLLLLNYILTTSWYNEQFQKCALIG